MAEVQTLAKVVVPDCLRVSSQSPTAEDVRKAVDEALKEHSNAIRQLSDAVRNLQKVVSGL